jgi:hypothetical protein
VAVADILARRRGDNPDDERLRMVFRLGSLAAWNLAVELHMDYQAIARAAAYDGTDAFSEAERDRLLDLLEDFVNERMGVTATEEGT